MLRCACVAGSLWWSNIAKGSFSNAAVQFAGAHRGGGREGSGNDCADSETSQSFMNLIGQCSHPRYHDNGFRSKLSSLMGHVLKTCQ